MLLDRPEVPITRPRNYRAPEEAPDLPEEGALVIDRTCRAERDASGWVLLTFDTPPGAREETPRWALPCALLEALESVMDSTPRTAFRISGESTLYDGRSFLLLRKVTVLSSADEETASPPQAASQPAPAATQPAGAAKSETAGPAASRPAATQPASQPKGKAPVGPSSEDVMRELLREKPGKPVIVPKDNLQNVAGTEPSVAPIPKEQPLAAGRGDMAVDRLVTLAPVGIGRWLQVSFESDNTLREPPLRLLPCENLGRAEVLAAQGLGRAVRLRITGEITRYKGRRYLLLRKILTERDLGQF